MQLEPGPPWILKLKVSKKNNYLVLLIDGWIPGLFERESEELIEKYKSAESDWLKINGDSNAAMEIRKIQQEIGEL